jgi:hypothetical protein
MTGSCRIFFEITIKLTKHGSYLFRNDSHRLIGRTRGIHLGIPKLQILSGNAFPFGYPLPHGARQIGVVYLEIIQGNHILRLKLIQYILRYPFGFQINKPQKYPGHHP